MLFLPILLTQNFITWSFLFPLCDSFLSLYDKLIFWFWVHFLFVHLTCLILYTCLSCKTKSATYFYIETNIYRAKFLPLLCFLLFILSLSSLQTALMMKQFDFSYIFSVSHHEIINLFLNFSSSSPTDPLYLQMPRWPVMSLVLHAVSLLQDSTAERVWSVWQWLLYLHADRAEWRRRSLYKKYKGEERDVCDHTEPVLPEVGCCRRTVSHTQHRHAHSDTL